MCQSLCVSVHLFTVTLKILNASLVPGLEFKSADCLSKCLGTLPKIMGEVLVTGSGRKQLLQQLNSYCYYDYYLFYCILAGNNTPFRVIRSTSSG